MMICKWKLLFGLNLGGHLSTCPSVGPFGLRNPQKYLEGVHVLFQSSQGISYNTITGKYPGVISGNIKVVRLSEEYVDTF